MHGASLTRRDQRTDRRGLQDDSINACGSYRPSAWRRTSTPCSTPGTSPGKTTIPNSDRNDYQLLFRRRSISYVVG